MWSWIVSKTKLPAFFNSDLSLLPISIRCCFSLASCAICLAAALSFWYNSSFVALESIPLIPFATPRSYPLPPNLLMSSCNCWITNSYNIAIISNKDKSIIASLSSYIYCSELSITYLCKHYKCYDFARIIKKMFNTQNTDWYNCHMWQLIWNNYNKYM